MKKKTKKRKS